MSKGIQLAIAALTVFAGVVWLVSRGTGGEGTFRYFESVGDLSRTLVESRGDIEAIRAAGSRVHGFVVDGSIERDIENQHVDFAIRDADGLTQLSVRLRGIELPDLFADGTEVVVEGRLGERLFVADRVLAKCPSKYAPEAEREARAGDAARPGRGG